MVAPDQLASVPLFQSLTGDELSELAGWFEVQHASPGLHLIPEGAAGYSFFILLDGSAEVTAGESTLASLGPGDFFGEMAILGDGRRMGTVTATSPVTLLAMFGTEFRRLQQTRPEIAARIEETVRRRVEENSRVEGFGGKAK